MENRKIGMRDWVHIRKWYLYCFALGVCFIGVAFGSGSSGDWGLCIFSVILGVLLLIVMSIFMAKDKELNEKNGVKRFWLNF